jgi:hypothetical protein
MVATPNYRCRAASTILILREGRLIGETVEVIMSIATSDYCAEQFVPEELAALADPQAAMRAIAKTSRVVGKLVRNSQPGRSGY